MRKSLRKKTNTLKIKYIISLDNKNIKEYLIRLTKDQLVKDIIYHSKNVESVKDYYRIRISDGFNKKIFDKYKKTIRDEFFPEKGNGELRLSIAKKAISSYRKIANDKKSQADLMIYYVEMGVKFTNEYGDIYDTFYESMEKMYEDALDFIFQNNLQEVFHKRCEKNVKDTSGIGWGFHDTLVDIYCNYYNPGNI